MSRPASASSAAADARDRVRSLMVADDLPAYHLSIASIELGLGVSVKRGLSAEQVATNRLKYGSNRLREPKQLHPVLMFLKHMVNPITFILYCVFIIQVRVHQCCCL